MSQSYDPKNEIQLSSDAHVYFLGIGGTGMASVAGLCSQAGYKVTGSDAGVYPPMSDMLAGLQIPVTTPYCAKNITDSSFDADMVVIANVLSRGNEELEAVLDRGIPYTSFPKLLSDVFLQERTPIVIAGTHGKTTTCSLTAHILRELGEDPGFFIGGIPRNFTHSFNLGTGPLFILEGDEYDTAFFDKGPKFLHYRPEYAILNNLEFDHADIYENVEAIEKQFAALSELVSQKSGIIANMDDPGIAKLVRELGIREQVTTVATNGVASECKFSAGNINAVNTGPAEQEWTAQITTPDEQFEIKTSLSGFHNIANITQTIALLWTLGNNGKLRNKFDSAKLCNAIASFKSVKRRLDHLGSFDGVELYEDFAHHPTAMRKVIEGFKKVYPDKRLIVAFEPRSAIQRRNVFESQYCETLKMADRIFIGQLFVDKRIPDNERMNIDSLRNGIGNKATSFATNEEMANSILNEVRPGDAVIFMSSGSFSGVQHAVAQKLGSKS